MAQLQSLVHKGPATALAAPGSVAHGSDPRAVSLPSNQREGEWWRHFGQAYSRHAAPPGTLRGPQAKVTPLARCDSLQRSMPGCHRPRATRRR
jgi:hypothetical protein